MQRKSHTLFNVLHMNMLAGSNECTLTHAGTVINTQADSETHTVT